MRYIPRIWDETRKWCGVENRFCYKFARLDRQKKRSLAANTRHDPKTCRIYKKNEVSSTVLKGIEQWQPLNYRLTHTQHTRNPQYSSLKRMTYAYIRNARSYRALSASDFHFSQSETTIATRRDTHSEQLEEWAKSNRYNNRFSFDSSTSAWESLCVCVCVCRLNTILQVRHSLIEHRIDKCVCVFVYL